MSRYLPLKLGEYRCLLIQDRVDYVSLEVAFPNADRSELEARDIAGQDIPLSYTCLYVDTGSHKVLIDTGNGVEREGTLVANLEAAGIQPDDIDTVVLTHAHGDHYGGLLDTDAQRQFPNAEIVISRAEWDYHSTADYLETLKSRSIDLHQLFVRNVLELKSHVRLVEHGEEIVPGIRLVAAPGHTMHHAAIEIRSAGKVLLNAGDAWVHPVNVEYPEWQFFRDADMEKAIQTRWQLATLAAHDNMIVLGYHFPFPGLIRISHDDGVFRYEPTDIMADDHD